jgi:hypothetical protein
MSASAGCGRPDRIQRDIHALGAVNLATLDENWALPGTQAARCAVADLNEAMTTLEDAIRKIDMETRDLLSSTFDASMATLAACSRAVRRRQCPVGDDRRGNLDAGVSCSRRAR